MRCLVTGGCGFIGSHLVKELYGQGHDVTVVDDLSSGDLGRLVGKLPTRVVTCESLFLYVNSEAAGKDKGKVIVVNGDFAHDNVLTKVRTKQFDVIFHLAANPRVAYSVEKPTATHEVNVHKTVALFQLAAQSDTRVVFSSSAAVYGDPPELPSKETADTNPNSPYGLQKLHCEEYARLFSELYGLDVVSLRYFNVYGPGQTGGSSYATAIAAWCNAQYTDSTLRSDGDGEQTRDMVYVADVVEANMSAATKMPAWQGEVINVATGDSVSNNEILSLFEERFGDLDVFNAPERRGDVKHTLADVTLMKELLGLDTTISLTRGLELTWQWWDEMVQQH